MATSDHEMVRVRILYGESGATNMSTTLDLRNDKSGFLKDLHRGIP